MPGQNFDSALLVEVVVALVVVVVVVTSVQFKLLSELKQLKVYHLKVLLTFVINFVNSVYKSRNFKGPICKIQFITLWVKPYFAMYRTTGIKYIEQSMLHAPRVCIVLLPVYCCCATKSSLPPCLWNCNSPLNTLSVHNKQTPLHTNHNIAC